MLRRSRIAQSVFGAALIAALGFGASELRATSSNCPYQDWIGQLGYCYDGDDEECNARCQRDIPGSPGGFCDPNNCCVCAY